MIRGGRSLALLILLVLILLVLWGHVLLLLLTIALLRGLLVLVLLIGYVLLALLPVTLLHSLLRVLLVLILLIGSILLPLLLGYTVGLCVVLLIIPVVPGLLRKVIAHHRSLSQGVDASVAPCIQTFCGAKTRPPEDYPLQYLKTASKGHVFSHV